MAGKSRLVDQKRLRAKKRKRIFFISLYLFFFLGLIVCALSYLSTLSVFQVTDISVTGAVRESSARIESIARDALADRYLWLFSRADTFIYPRSAIEDGVLALPLVSSIDISRRGLTALTISITEREEKARWCNADEACYSVDESGFVFAPTALSSAFVYRGLLAGSPVGQHLLTADTFKSMQFFIREIRNLNLTPTEAHLSENGYLDVVLAGGGTLIVYTEDDLSTVLTTLESVISDKRIAPSIPEFLAHLDYLRLDAGNKVTYKKK